MDLAQWVQAKREDLKRLRADARHATPSIRDFTGAVTTHRRGLAVIAELSRATPEEGTVVEDLDVARRVAVCDEANVAAIAIGTDALALKGSPLDLAAASRATTTPLLQRDLILTDEQLYEARQCQADATVLQAGALRPDQVKRLVDLAASMHMVAPVEVRSRAEWEAALAAGARALVVPAFPVDCVDLELLASAPKSVTLIVRGPFSDAAALAPLKGKADAVWICAPWLLAADPAAFLKALVVEADAT